MNRAERRAIQFGNAFNPTRNWYQRHYGYEEIRLPYIQQESNDAFTEHCNNTNASESDRLWDHEGIYDF